MRLFAPDLYRNFGIGFMAGAIIVAGSTIDQWGRELAPPAQAAAPFNAPQASPEFLIAPAPAGQQ